MRMHARAIYYCQLTVHMDTKLFRRLILVFFASICNVDAIIINTRYPKLECSNTHSCIERHT